MQRFLLGFCGGAIVLAVPWPADERLPEWLYAAGTGALVVVLVLAAVGWRQGRVLERLLWAGLPLGLVWSGLAHQAALAARLQDAVSGTTITVTGEVMDEPVQVGTGAAGLPAQRFRARLGAEYRGAAANVPGAQVRLTWYGGPEVARGEIWQWTAVLQAPWSYANPGGFDYERWLLGAGLQGTGYVRDGERLQSAVSGPVERARQALVARVRALQSSHGGILLALLVGYGGDISESSWKTLRATGTVHLMVISGLHVSLAAALGFAAGRLGARLVPWLPLWLDVRLAGCFTGGAVAVAYVLLAGAGLPALRALMMSAATLALLARARTGRLGSGLLVALTVLLAVQPLAIHQTGFWLSFGAVAILYLCLGHRHGESRTRALLRGQFALSVGMLPLVALFTGALPLTSMPANLVAVPVMSLVVVPVVLLAGMMSAVWSAAAGWMLLLADGVVGAVMWWLEWLAQAPLPAASGGSAALAAAQAAALCWLLGAPRILLPGLTLCWLLPLAAAALGVSHGDYRVMALDVGQGTAVAVDTMRHRLLFDAGPGFPSGFETGSAVVVPSLVATGPPRLDVLILSHDDVDHTGGAEAVRTRLRPQRVFESVRSSVSVPDGNLSPPVSADAGRAVCHGRRWHWDGVTFRLLDVARPRNALDNDRSCILLVDNGRHRMLIAGDVGARVEAAVLRRLVERDAPVHLMFAPHHGSRSSSSPALVRVLRPSLVLVNAGRGNRFGHPHPHVVARYQQVGARLYQTGREGALIWSSRTPDRVVRWRRDRAPYWRGRDSGEPFSRR